MNTNVTPLGMTTRAFLPSNRQDDRLVPEELGLPRWQPTKEEILRHFYSGDPEDKLQIKVVEFSRDDLKNDKPVTGTGRRLRLSGLDPLRLEVTPVVRGKEIPQDTFTCERLDDWHYYVEASTYDAIVYKCVD